VTRAGSNVPHSDRPEPVADETGFAVEAARVSNLPCKCADSSGWVSHGRLRNARPTPAERLANPLAVLSRTDLRDLGFERRAVDAIFRACPVVALPDYARPLILVRDYLRLIEGATYRDGETVRLA
jgi:hypothetical protein